VLAEFYFIITYRPEKQNKLVNILIYKKQDLQIQNDTKVASRTQILLPKENLDLRISANLLNSLKIILIKGITFIELIDQLLQTN